MPPNGFLSAVVSVMAGLFVDSLPFLLGGSLLSVLIHELVPAKVLVRLFNRSAWSGVALASVSGLFLPLCECGIVPVVRTLLRRGVRPSVAAVVFFALPLVNPLVAFSTFAAFPDRPSIAWGRLLAGWVGVVLLGVFFVAFEKRLFPAQDVPEEDHCFSCTDHDHLPAKPSLGQRLAHIANHTWAEVYGTGRYLVVGIVLASFMQVLFAAPPLGFAGGRWVEPLVFMALAFALSLCSTTDAFVARGFQTLVAPGSVVSFLLMGPLLHLRNLLLLKSVFPLKTVLVMVAAVSVVVYAGGIIFNLWSGVF